MDIRGGAMINRSEIPDDLIQGMVDSALEAYHTVFPKPGCDVEITVCRDLEDLAHPVRLFDCVFSLLGYRSIQLADT